MRLRRKAVNIVVDDDEAPPPLPRASNGHAATAVVDPESPIHWTASLDDALPIHRLSTPGNTGLLGERLVARGVIAREQLEHALAEQVASGKRLGTQLVELGFIGERQLVETLADQLEVKVADLRLTVPDPAAVARFPEELARGYDVVPLSVVDDQIEIAVSDLLTEEAMTAIEAGVGCPIKVVLAPPSEIKRAIDQAYLALDGVEQQVRAFEDFEQSRPRVEVENEIVVDDNAPVVQVVTMLLTQAVRDRASDIHIEPQDGFVRVRFRVDGVLNDVTRVPESMAQALIGRIKVMADMNIVERRRPQDGQIQTAVDGRPLDVRVATTATIWGEKAVLRILDKTQSLRSMSELGMPRDVGDRFSKLVMSPFGMVICAGPTGSGKTTTLYAALTEINAPDRNITTIEDPVEYVLPSINQIQVNRQAGLTFADGLKSIMRQDPDVILVGEIRDVETARIAVQSALTGHFVLSSLHATDTVTALQRLKDMGIEPFLITASMLAVVSQRLVRRICNSCREPYEPTAEERAFVERYAGIAKEQWWHGAGCNICAHTGYASRLGVYEMLPMSDRIRQMVIDNATYDDMRAVAVSEGMRTLRDEAARFVAEDITTVAEVIRSVYVR